MSNNKFPLYKIIFSIIYICMYPILIFAISGDIKWVEGWIYSIWFLSFSIIIFIYLYFKDPDLLAERFKISKVKNQKKWDKFFLSIVTVIYFVWFVTMPLDAKRLAWTVNFPLWFEFVGGICLLISSFFMFRSLADNTFTSPLVRIQEERNQHVVSTGVYGIIRHPMYLGAILMFLSLPLLLGSKYGFLIGIILALLFVIRTIGEEKMLVEELEGYVDYKKKVKYRLIPFIW